MMDVLVSEIGIGCDYSTIGLWENFAVQCDHLFHVGLIYDGFYEFADHVELTKRLRHFDFQFLWMAVTGDRIAWRVGENLVVETIDHHALHDKPRLDEAASLRLVNDFLQDRHIEEGDVFTHIYHSEDYEEKLQLILTDFSKINDQLMSCLENHPEYLHKLHWRKFEEVLDVLFRGLGYDTELTPRSGDKGVDLRLIDRTDIGPLMVLVQAKKHAAKYPITLGPVLALYGAVSAEQASKGILVSTSEFQPAAKNFAKTCPFLIELAGPDEIREWLHTYAKRRRDGI